MPFPSSRSILPAVLLALASTPLLAAETEWPQFRGPLGQGNSAAANVPTKWGEADNVAWRVDLPGKGWSSPVVSKGRIYLTSATSDGKTTLRALCLDAANGQVVWNTELFQPDAGSAGSMHRKNSLASPTPIVADGKMYVHFGHMGSAALDLNGKVLWRQTGLKYPPTHGNGGSPILTDGLLVFSCDAAKDPFIAALDTTNGNVKWKVPRDTTAKKQFSFSTPLALSLGGKTQVVSPGSGFVGGYDAANGKELWRVRYGEGYSVVPRPVYAHGLLYVSSSFDQAVLYAIRPEGAKGDATDSAIVWSAKKGAPHTASAVVVGDEVYFVSDAGIATCADAKTGSIHWTERVGGNYSASPVAAGGNVYFLNETGTTAVVKAGTKFELVAKNDLGEATLASPAVIDGTIFIRGEQHLWKIGK